MAIVIQEEQQSTSGIMIVVIWGVILLVIGVAVYYVFFKNPEIVATKTPSNFENTEQISKIKLDPNEVLSDPKFQALKAHVSPIVLPSVGRVNPFLNSF